MILLSPRFLALPLIAFAIIVSLPRGADPSAAARATAAKAMVCAPSASTACVAAAPGRSIVR
jgi:hypothetical protein